MNVWDAAAEAGVAWDAVRIHAEWVIPLLDRRPSDVDAHADPGQLSGATWLAVASTPSPATEALR